MHCADLRHACSRLFTSTNGGEPLIDGLTRTLDIKGIGRNSLYTNAFHNSRLEQFSRVVQSALSSFVEA